MAGEKISQLPAVSSALLTDFLPVVQAGVTSKETLQQILTLFNGHIQLASISQVSGIGTPTGTVNIVFSNSPTITSPNIVGVTNGSNAAAGSVGEIISSTVTFASPVTITNSNTPQDVTSISLTAGDWDVFGIVGLNNNTIGMTIMATWISATSATEPTAELRNTMQAAVGAGVSSWTGPCPFYRASISTTTTLYMSCLAQFGSGTQIAYGSIYARRTR
jgi:hypothetical protein